jgi:hypothetical protein
VRDAIFIPKIEFLCSTVLFMAARVMWNVTLLLTGVASSLGFWITYNMAGFRHFVSVHKMKDGNMARLSYFLSGIPYVILLLKLRFQ